jgi:hypothetical protein
MKMNANELLKISANEKRLSKTKCPPTEAHLPTLLAAKLSAISFLQILAAVPVV